MTKEELNGRLIAIAEGDADAFGDVYREWYKPVFLLAASMTRETALAEDVAQEVFLTVRQCADRYRPGGQARAWLFGITKNIARYFIRRQNSGPAGQAGLSDDTMKAWDLPEEAFEKGCLDAIVVSQALKILNAAEYRITVLHVFAGLNLSEIAAFDQTPYGTVLWRYDRAKHKLRRFYAAAEQQERSGIR